MVPFAPKSVQSVVLSANPRSECTEARYRLHSAACGVLYCRRIHACSLRKHGTISIRQRAKCCIVGEPTHALNMRKHGSICTRQRTKCCIVCIHALNVRKHGTCCTRERATCRIAGDSTLRMCGSMAPLALWSAQSVVQSANSHSDCARSLGERGWPKGLANGVDRMGWPKGVG